MNTAWWRRRALVPGLALALGGALLGQAQAATAVTDTAVVLRRTPVATGTVLKMVPAGTLLTVACEGDWCRTTYQGRGGYLPRAALRSLTRSAPLTRPFYATCAAMQAVAAAPVRLGDLGYRAALDTNRNGWACDSGDR